MVQGVFEGIATAIGSILTLGSTNAVKTGLKSGFQAMGKVAINAVKKRVSDLFKSNAKNTIINKAQSILKEKSKEFAIEMASNIIPQAYCKGVWDESIKKLTIDTTEFDQNRLLAAVDIFSIKDVVDNCQNTTADGGLACATKVVGTLANFDPTGLLTIAGAFMHPICEVTTVDYRQTQTEEQKATEQLLNITYFLDDTKYDQNCVHLWSQCNFMGQYYKACVTQDLHNFSDIASSIYVGTKRSATFFEHMAFKGRFLTFGPGTAIQCLSLLNNAQYNLNNIISSVAFDISHCYIINFKISMIDYQEGTNNILCNNLEPNANIDIRNDIDIDNKLIQIKTSIKNANITLYEGPNYTGKQVFIYESKIFENKAILGLNRIGSYKIETKGWIATVASHEGYNPATGIHTIALSRYTSSKEAFLSYNFLNYNVAKKLISKENPEIMSSNPNSKFIVNALRKYQESDKANGIPYIWVSYYINNNPANTSYLNQVKMFENEEEAKNYYNTLPYHPKKFTSKGNVVSYDDIEALYALL